MRLSRLAGSAAALLVGAVAGLGLLAPAPAQAAACSGSEGVTVVVDFAELGGGLTAGCAPSSGGDRARAVFAAAGYSLTTATKAPSFVCRVNGLPADDPCVDAAPPDRYWSLWWADGKGGSWTYAALGVDALKVPDGAYLAFAWHQGSGKAQPPATVPVSREPKPTPSQKPQPTQKPNPQPSSRPTSGGGQKAPASSGTPTAGAGPSATPTSGPEASASAGASPSASDSPTASDEPTPNETVSVDPDLPSADELTLGPEDAAPTAAEQPSGLPGWVVPVVLIALVTAGALVVVRRRQA